MIERPIEIFVSGSLGQYGPYRNPLFHIPICRVKVLLREGLIPALQVLSCSSFPPRCVKNGSSFQIMTSGLLVFVGGLSVSTEGLPTISLKASALSLACNTDFSDVYAGPFPVRSTVVSFMAITLASSQTYHRSVRTCLIACIVRLTYCTTVASATGDRPHRVKHLIQ